MSGNKQRETNPVISYLRLACRRRWDSWPPQISPSEMRWALTFEFLEMSSDRFWENFWAELRFWEKFSELTTTGSILSLVFFFFFFLKWHNNEWVGRLLAGSWWQHDTSWSGMTGLWVSVYFIWVSLPKMA